jgi:NADH-quinone oxidoreductase subunit E
MLSDKEIDEIQKEMKMYPAKSAACIEALKIVQNERRWISDECIDDIADLLEMSAAEVDGIATFYSRIYRKPVGRNIILLCDSVTCMMMGFDTLYEHLSKKLGIHFGETTPDDRFTLLPNTCLGDCNNAPALMINNDMYNHVTIDKIDELLKKYQ